MPEPLFVALGLLLEELPKEKSTLDKTLESATKLFAAKRLVGVYLLDVAKGAGVDIAEVEIRYPSEASLDETVQSQFSYGF